MLASVLAQPAPASMIDLLAFSSFTSAIAVSNDSGHYRPRQAQLQKFVQWIKGAGAFQRAALVFAYLDNGTTYRGNPAAFLSL